MGYIIRVGYDWTDIDCEELREHLTECGFDDSIIIRDGDMEVFEYDELDNVTVYEDDIAEELGLDVDEVSFLDGNSLNGGIN